MKFYELNVKGLTMLHPLIPNEKKGKFLGVCDPVMINHFKTQHVDVIQLMPVFDKHETYWGYDPISWMELNPEFGTLEEFKEMLNTLQAHGFKVILDVVYNHTAVPLDGVTYYKGDLHNITGCGNTVDVRASLDVIMESIHYWMRDIGVDGMRFDLAAVMGIENGVFNKEAEFFKQMWQYQDKILVAEPYAACGYYEFGNFPDNWLELNCKFRDAVRQNHEYWCNEIDWKRSVNFITCHDGFTLEDLVSYSRKYNDANGEDNRDGRDDNHSYNHGVEGVTSCPDVLNARKASKDRMQWQLEHHSYHYLVLAGDEVDNTQFGNNNAYCQDNEIGWVIWPELN